MTFGSPNSKYSIPIRKPIEKAQKEHGQFHLLELVCAEWITESIDRKARPKFSRNRFDQAAILIEATLYRLKLRPRSICCTFVDTRMTFSHSISFHTKILIACQFFTHLPDTPWVLSTLKEPLVTLIAGHF